MARSIHLEKRGIRCLAIAESFKPDHLSSTLAGTVMRKDFVIDGFVFGHTELSGDDATDVILSMFERLGRNDISCILLSGLVISLYNIVDIKRLYDLLQMPIIGITCGSYKGLEQVLKDRFPASYESKLAMYGRLGPQNKISLHTLCDLFIRCKGCSISDAARLLDDLTLQGSLPEPVRISQMLSRTIRSELSL